MRLVAPSYYGRFRCIADRCRHTCCAGWEIDVDDASLERFRCMQGNMGRRLQQAIAEDETGAHFVLTEDERCPFLNRSGLCDLISELGEESLCQICADHPRFRSFWADRTEIGLGLCCEAAAALILGWAEPVNLVVLEDDGQDDMPDEEETELLHARDVLTACMQRRDVPVLLRARALPQVLGDVLPEVTNAELAALLLSLEWLDPAWTALLEQLRDLPDETPQVDTLALPLEQLMVYLLYRHLPEALDDGDPCSHLRVCLLMWATAVRLLAFTNGTAEALCELARMLSAELEYSQENLDALLDFAVEMDEKSPLR